MDMLVFYGMQNIHACMEAHKMLLNCIHDVQHTKDKYSSYNFLLHSMHNSEKTNIECLYGMIACMGSLCLMLPRVTHAYNFLS